MFKKKHILEMLWNCSKSNLKNMFIQLDHLPRDRDENSKNIYLKPPPRFKLSASEFHFPNHTTLWDSLPLERWCCVPAAFVSYGLDINYKMLQSQSTPKLQSDDLPPCRKRISPAKSRMGFWFFLPPLALLLDSLALLGEIFLGAIIGISQKLDKATTDFSNSLTMSSTWWFQPIWKISFPQGWWWK